jgi:hypothetical protein
MSDWREACNDGQLVEIVDKPSQHPYDRIEAAIELGYRGFYKSHETTLAVIQNIITEIDERAADEEEG